MGIEEKKSQQNKQPMTYKWLTPSELLVTCPVWHNPLYVIVPGGITTKCKYCQGRIHFYSREEIERVWNEMEKFQQSNEIKQVLP